MKSTVPQISVRNLQRKITINVADLERFAREAVTLCRHLPQRSKTGLETLSEVAVLIISDRRMAALHRRFMNETGPTDVITFQHGEIFISVDTAVRNARRFGSKLPSELRLYIVHGLLHLHGFDDRDAAAMLKMRATERTILSKLRR